MRIATWNVNSLKARADKVVWWLERARPDVLLLQETKLADDNVPRAMFEAAGYHVVHRGEGRWNGVAIASRTPFTEVVVDFGAPLATPGPDDAGDDEPLAEARMIAARTANLHVVCIYAPNGRLVGSPFYRAKLEWFERLAAWLAARKGGDDLVLGGDFNIAPADDDAWDPGACHGGTHVSPPEREAFAKLGSLGLVDAYRLLHARGGRYTWWDYRAGAFPRNLGMRIDHLLLSRALAARVVAAEIDREARKGSLPSDHAPLVVDIDEPGHAFDAGWAAAEARIASRRAR